MKSTILTISTTVTLFNVSTLSSPMASIGRHSTQGLSNHMDDETINKVCFNQFCVSWLFALWQVFMCFCLLRVQLCCWLGSIVTLWAGHPNTVLLPSQWTGLPESTLLVPLEWMSFPHGSTEKICPWALEHTKHHCLSIYHAALFCTVVFYSPAQYNFNLISCSVNHSTFSSVCFYFYPTSSHLRHRGSALHH